MVPPTPTEPGWRRHWALPVLACLVLALGITWPLILDPTGQVVGANRGDVWNSIWGLWFSAAQGSVLPSHTGLLDHPSGGVLALADPVNALLAWPLSHTIGPVGAYAVLVIGHLWLGSLAAFALGRATGGHGWIAALAWPMAPVCLSFLHNGSSEAVSITWLPLACLAIIRAVERGRWWRLWAGLLLALTALAGWYAGVAAWCFAGAVLLIGWRGIALSTRARRLGPGLVLALGLTLPAAHTVRSVAMDQDGLVDIKNDEDLGRIRRTLGAADPRTFVAPLGFRSPDFARVEGNPTDFVHTSQVGFVLFGLALWGSRRRRDPAASPPPSGTTAVFWVAGLAGAVLAMGPVVVWDGRPLALTAREISLPLPYLLLEALPGFSSLSLLYRLSAMLALALAILADRCKPAWALLIAAEVLLLSSARGLPAITPVPALAALSHIAQDPDPTTAVLNLPPTAARAYMYEQTLHGHPMVASLNAGMNVAGLKVGTAARRMKTGQATKADVVTVAHQQGVRWVVVHKDQLMEENWIESAGQLRLHFDVVAETEKLRVIQLY